MMKQFLHQRGYQKSIIEMELEEKRKDKGMLWQQTKESILEARGIISSNNSITGQTLTCWAYCNTSFQASYSGRDSSTRPRGQKSPMGTTPGSPFMIITRHFNQFTPKISFFPVYLIFNYILYSRY